MRDASVHEARAPDVRWHAIGGHAGAEAGVAIADLARAGLAAGADSAIGLLSDGASRTLTLDLGLDEPGVFSELPGFPAGPDKRRSWVADVSWDGAGVRELALRTAARDGARLEEYSARLDLRDAGNRAVAERLLHPGAASPADLAALVMRIKSHGVIERDGYAVTERRRGFSVAGKLGLALGLDHQRISAQRRLVDAVAWNRGGPAQRRFDCLGV
jgi:hypothetical protein